jgi:hypothetical protein
MAIQMQTIEERHLSSLILSFDLADFKRAQARIRAFVAAFDEEFGRDGRADVHCLGLQFFRLTNRETEETT